MVFITTQKSLDYIRNQRIMIVSATITNQEIKMDKIANLAKEMNVSENDLIGFLSAIKIWLDKGYSLENAIEKNMLQMNRLVNNCVKLSNDNDMQQMAINSFYD